MCASGELDIPVEVVAKDRVLYSTLDQKRHQIRLSKVAVNVLKLETLHKLQEEQQQILISCGANEGET